MPLLTPNECNAKAREIARRAYDTGADAVRITMRSGDLTLRLNHPAHVGDLMVTRIDRPKGQYKVVEAAVRRLEAFGFRRLASAVARVSPNAPLDRSIAEALYRTEGHGTLVYHLAVFLRFTPAEDISIA